MTALPIMAARSAFLCSALIMAFACPASAAPPQPAGKPTVLHLSQTAERQLPRDLLHVEMRAENAAGDPQLVQAAINRVMARILPELRQVNGPPENGCHVFPVVEIAELTQPRSALAEVILLSTLLPS